MQFDLRLIVLTEFLIHAPNQSLTRLDITKNIYIYNKYFLLYLKKKK